MILRLKSWWTLTIVVCLIPFCRLLIDIVFDNLGSNPIQALHIRLGDWSLRFLWLTLTITPMQKVTKWRGMADYRQMLGLYTFFYATLHLMAYLLLDHALMWRIIALDIIESPYIWFGLLAYGIVLSLTLTSSKCAKKRMGKTWKKLHRLIYIASVAAMIHYYWQLKGNLAEPLFYLLIVVLLLGFRVSVWIKDRRFKKMLPTNQRNQALETKRVAMPEITYERHKTLHKNGMSHES